MSAILDPLCKYKGTIYQDYTCTLNMTDLKTNANKFYIMQIIDGGNNTFGLFIRYGRIGEHGRISYTDSSKVDPLIEKFKKQFKSKTKNTWENRQNFKRFAGKYHLCDLQVSDSSSNGDGGSDGSDGDGDGDGDGGGEEKCTLGSRVQSLIELISDLKMMTRTLKNLDIDLKKMPLGKISEAQLDRAFQILQEIKGVIDLINQRDNSDQYEIDVDLVSEFYTLIPYSCGRRKPPIINTSELVNKFTEIIDELRNIEIAQEIVNKTKDKSDSTLHPCDRIYQEIQTSIKALEPDSSNYQMIQTYLENSHGATHTGCRVKLLDIYEIERQGERAKYQNFCQEKGIDRKMLLWHGTRLANFISIMKMGLILRPDVIPGTYISGKMFGYGIYGANSFSKSLNYTGWEKGQEACLFLAEFAVGKQKKLMSHDYYVSEPALRQEGFDSVWGRGENTITEIGTLDDGVLIPQGKLVKATRDGDEFAGSGYGRDFNLIYDEFIVYNEAQLCLKYVVKVKCI